MDTAGDRGVHGRKTLGQERPGGRDDRESAVQRLDQRVRLRCVRHPDFLARARVLLENLATAAQEANRQAQLTQLFADERPGVAGRAEDCDGSVVVAQGAEDTVPE